MSFAKGLKPKRVAVLQSNYIPWKGYFDIINDVDLFIFYDDLQYTKGDWRNRNLIKTASGVKWLTIPVGSSEHRLICEVRLPNTTWARKHWKTIQQNYNRAPHFERYRPFFEDVFLGRKWENLSELNQYLIRSISRELLGLSTEFSDSRNYALAGRKLGRLLDLLSKAGATAYVSGPSARAYIDPSQFNRLGIELIWKDYSGYPEYPQFFPPFSHHVSIIDLLFQAGPDSQNYIWGWRKASNRES
jgi:hypothetical protein